MRRKVSDSIAKVCKHCGDQLRENVIVIEDQDFCCQGCANVFSLLQSSGLSGYYSLNDRPGSSLSNPVPTGQFDVFDDPKVASKMLEFQQANLCKVRTSLPAIHCSSCIYLLENMEKIDTHIQNVRVDFLKREATIIFETDDQFSLKDLFILLARIGYPPKISLQNLSDSRKERKIDNKLLYQLGLAGFVFGNIMLLSFPEYLGFEEARSHFFIGYINLALATPLLFFVGGDFIKSAFLAIKSKSLNIDVPLAVGIVALYSRSAIEILSNSGEGYFDSFSGLLFFLLIGRYVQQITHRAIDFERNYRSYFPISVMKKIESNFQTVTLDQVEVGDILFIKSDEIIPTDGIVSEGLANLDYSFVSGESDIVEKKIGEKIYAGGRHKGHPFYMITDALVEQSKLTRLWQEDVFNDKKEKKSKLLDKFGQFFTWGILILALVTGAYWWVMNDTVLWKAVTAVLIVACPCAISMAPPFTYSNMMRLLSRNRFFLKNIQTVESFQQIDQIIFDKTGTLTDSDYEVKYQGKNLDDQELSMVKSLCNLSTHPLSKAIASYFKEIQELKLSNFNNYIGSGISASLFDKEIRMGSSEFIFGTAVNPSQSNVFLEVDGKYIGNFTVRQNYKAGLTEMIKALQSKGYKIGVLTGDTDRDDKRLRNIVGDSVDIHYHQLPVDKLNYIKKIQSKGQRVLMIGDGLNDAGALKQSDIGIVVSEDNNNFTPACDAIIDANNFTSLPIYIDFLRKSKWIIYGALVLAILYNVIGLMFAVTGSLSPVVAAILMPVSSISVIIYALISSNTVLIWPKRQKIKVFN